MAKLLQVDFGFNGPFGKEMANALVELAESINYEPGMLWKIWTENEKDKLGGGIYLFEDETSAQAYLEMHTARLQRMGIREVRGRIFDINPALTDINNGPVVSSQKIMTKKMAR
ncbi:monooxygenase [Vibrio vulnificus CladeA-yb158]|uniref:monooxygenase n=1 Tax=Vibrio vulnificus TaxID=672 RepID=UPI00063DB0C1|nr:monooxygenase [Vibrio vulnificus]ELH4810220.1 monooxygenase [Vibrio vulnificus]KLI68171.1 monooxygenase [Vibrio vulnificus CladeA-yb158]